MILPQNNQSIFIIIKNKTMSYQEFNKFPSYKTTYIPAEKRTNQDLAYETTGKYVFCADRSRKEQRVYEVVSIDKYANKVKLKENNRKSIDPDFSITDMYDSNSKIWI
jgi:hypothetical protein